MITLHRYEKDGQVCELRANRMRAEDGLSWEDIRIRVDGGDNLPIIRNESATGHQYRYAVRIEGKLRYKTIPKSIIESYIREG